jgi:hypothetical protein
MSNGDSPDGFVFPPFIPRSAPPAARPAPPEPAPAAASPWELDATPAPVAESAPSPFAEEAAGDELPWLELPEPRAAAEPEEFGAAEVAEEPGALPDWMTWDARAEEEAEEELSATAKVEGLEEFDPVEAFAFEDDADDGEDEPAAFSLGAPDTYPYGDPEPEGGGPAAAEVTPSAAPDAEPELEEPYGFAQEVERFDDALPDPFTAAEIAATEAMEPAELSEEPSPAPAHHRAPSAFDEVADRLEQIARDLRQRPDELLAGRGADPLALIVAGYVMGYAQARRG